LFYIFSIPDWRGYSVFNQALAIAISAFCLKKIRSLTNANGEIKKIWRALGYICSPLFTPISLLFSVIIITGYVFYDTKFSFTKENFRLIPVKVTSKEVIAYMCIMCHHWHYFSYAYIVPIIAHNVYKIPIDVIGLIFYVGWIGYYLFLSVNQSQRLFVFIGHCLSAIAVLWLIFAQSMSLYLFLWLITGVGGGTIVLLRTLVIGASEEVYEQFKTWESFGHLLGIVSFGLSLTFNSTWIGYISGSFVGFLCAGLALFVGTTQHKKNSDDNDLCLDK
jgi:hypothetical protein